MMRWLVAACLGSGALVPLAAEEPPKAVPLVDPDAVSPDEGDAPLRVGEPQVFPGLPTRDRAESASGQFGVAGGSSELRGSLVLLAEEVRAGFQGLLGRNETPVTMPIEIVLRDGADEAPGARDLALDLRFTNETYLLNIQVNLSRGVDRERLRKAILRGLIYQRSLVDVAPGALDGPVRVPPWLVEGLLEAREWRRGAGDRRLYDGVFQRGGRFTMDELLAINEGDHAHLDGVSREMFRVLSGALVMALLDQRGGPTSVDSFCGEVARFGGEMPILLRRHFPELNFSEKSLVKWWELTLARLSDAPLTDAMGIAETERQLGRALVLRFEADGLPQQVPFDRRGEADDLDEAGRLAAIRSAQQALNRLSYRCFPSYRPLLVEYQELLAKWAGSGADPDDALRDLAETRAIMEARALRARDYLDYMEIAGASELSGSFEDYLRLKRDLAERPRVVKDDPISAYLDRMEAVYEPTTGR